MLDNLIVPTLNQYDRLQRMVQSIDYPVKHLLIIDNGGKLDSLTVPDFVGKCTILNMPSNLGVAASWNLGIKLFSLDECFNIASDDIAFGSGALEMIDQASHQDVIFTTDVFPDWQIFSIGSSVAAKVGLFDEAIYPANFEDDDYERRCSKAGVNILRLPIPHTHWAHSTVYATPESAENNQRTYESNREYFQNKIARNDYSSGGWDITRRRENSWE